MGRTVVNAAEAIKTPTVIQGDVARESERGSSALLVCGVACEGPCES